MDEMITKDERQVTEKQIQAAYALNLCSVSVSQIIDYNDIYILEQEYENILNNLNLQNIPKDEALLDILKRLLETITFCRGRTLCTCKNGMWRAAITVCIPISICKISRLQCQKHLPCGICTIRQGR